MREESLKYVVCPLCGSSDLDIEVRHRNAVEIRQGEVVCQDCRRHYPVRKGILNLLPRPDETIASEVLGWQEMLGETSEELVATMLELPYLDDGVWITTAENFDELLEKVTFADMRVLDIGAGRAWSSRRITHAGASYVMALDILTQRFIGLETADIYIESDGLYFERVLADMNQLPLQAQSFDAVFMNATLHHSSHIQQVMHGVARVLVDGGSAMIVSEPVRSVIWPHDLSGSPELAHGINEHTYTIFRYLGAALAAGLFPKIYFPRSIKRLLDRGDLVAARELGRSLFVLSWLWKHRLGRRAAQGVLLPFVYAISNMPLVMIAKKPGA